MESKLKIYICRHCGNIIVKLVDSGVPVVCCGEDMEELVIKTSDTAFEKHLPVVDIDGNNVDIKVGSVDHPMTEEHYIDWVILLTDSGYQIKYLDKTGEPKVSFITEDKVVGVYSYCNLHGLWYKEV